MIKMISIIKGRTKRLKLTIKALDEDYTLQPGDTVITTVKRSIYDDEPVLVKTGLDIVFNPQDTMTLEPGDYVFDVVLRMASGDVYTVIPASGGYSSIKLLRGVYNG